MSRFAEAPLGFQCPFRDHCPHVEGLSTRFLFEEYHRSAERERQSEQRRMEMAGEINALLITVKRLETENDHLRAENRCLHQKDFKSKMKPPDIKTSRGCRNSPGGTEDVPPHPRGAPMGHPPWMRETPQRVDKTVEVSAPAVCPHCQCNTDFSSMDASSYVQEDIVLSPQTVVTEYRHETAWCPCCQRQVRQILEGELPDAPIGPNAKAAALYLRHELKLSYRKIQTAMATLFGIDFVPASTLGFEKKARRQADSLHEDLIKKIRSSPCVHADETHWREDGENHYVFFAGDGNVAVFHIDASRSTEAAKVLLGEKLDSVLVTDAYAGYNGIEVLARQSCLAHLIRKASDVEKEIQSHKKPDPDSLRFCAKLRKLFVLACRVAIPDHQLQRDQLAERFTNTLDLLCETSMLHPKAETLRKRFLPGARERDEVFTCIRLATPPTNNLAERALRPLVIFRKVCMGTRSQTGSENIAVFASILETGKCQGAEVLDILRKLFADSAMEVHQAVFPAPD